MTPPRRRSEDRGAITRFYDWIDERDIDKHVVSLLILLGTVNVLRWGAHYAAAHPPGSDVALVIASVTAPYMALQAAAISFYFRART